MRTGPRDWWRILRDLKAAGISLAAVGRKVGRDESTVWGWGERGAEPKESDARMVLALYAKHCPELYAQHQRLYAIAGAAEAEANEAEAPARLVLPAQHRAKQHQAKAAPANDQQPLFGDQA